MDTPQRCDVPRTCITLKTNRSIFDTTRKPSPTSQLAQTRNIHPTLYSFCQDIHLLSDPHIHCSTATPNTPISLQRDMIRVSILRIPSARTLTTQRSRGVVNAVWEARCPSTMRDTNRCATIWTIRSRLHRHGERVGSTVPVVYDDRTNADIPDLGPGVPAKFESGLSARTVIPKGLVDSGISLEKGLVI